MFMFPPKQEISTVEHYIFPHVSSMGIPLNLYYPDGQNASVPTVSFAVISLNPHYPDSGNASVPTVSFAGISLNPCYPDGGNASVPTVSFVGISFNTTLPYKNCACVLHTCRLPSCTYNTHICILSSIYVVYVQHPKIWAYAHYVCKMVVYIIHQHCMHYVLKM